MFCRPSQRILLAWWLVAIVAPVPATVAEVSGPRAQPPYHARHWTTANGLPQNTVRSLLQARDGYLWIATRAGLARFDGVRFTIFNRANTPEMISDNCVTLTEDSDGGVWIGTEEGLLCWKDHHFTVSARDNRGLSHMSVRTLCVGRNGGVWIGTENGLDHLHRGAFTRYTTNQGLQANNIRAVFEDARGNVWVGTEIHEYQGGLQRMAPGTGKFVGVENYGMSMPLMVHFITSDKSGAVWWGNNTGLHRSGQDGVKDFGLEDGLSGGVVKWIHQGPNGDLTVVTGERSEVPGRRGLHRFKNGQFARIELTHFGVEDDVICALEDFEGNIWVGTRADGLIKLQPGRMTSVTHQDGLPDGPVVSVCEAPDGSIWVETKSRFAQIKDGQTLIPNWDRSDQGHCILVDARGALWLGQNHHGGLVTWWPGVQTNWFGSGRTPMLKALYLDRENRVWAGTDRGPKCFEDGQSAPKWSESNLPTNEVRSICQTRDGTLWFGTYGDGVIRLRDGHCTYFTTREGLASDRAWALHEDSEGALWAGTEKGLCRFKNEKFQSLTTKEGLFDDRVHQILEDDFDYFWISCLQGIYKVRRQELNEATDGKTKVVRCVAYGEADGMPSSETSGGHQPAGWKARDGRLWFPTVKGVVVIDPKTIQDNIRPPPVVIEQMKADEEVIRGDGAMNPRSAIGDPRLKLPPGRARVLEIRYTANSFVAPEKVRFRYQLVGHDKEWREAQDRRVAFYTNVRPGHYTFQVKACNHHGVWNESPATFAFSLAPHFWQTWPFYAGCALGLVGLAGGIQSYRLRVQRRILGLKQQHAVEQERARIARDLHDDLGAHLTGIALKADLTQRQLQGVPAAAGPLAEIAGSTRALVDNMRAAVWALNPRHDALEGTARFLAQQVEDFVTAAGLRCRLELPQEFPQLAVPSTARYQIHLVVKEALHNAVKHAGASEIRFRLAVDGPDLCLSITDNGHGFSYQESDGRAHQNGNGLTNMRQRAASLGGHWELKSGSAGTSVSVLIPTRSFRNVQP